MQPNVSTTNDLATIWRTVSGWPREQRRELATRIWRSLAAEAAPVPVSEERRQALQALIGCCKTDNPPNDEEVERIIEEERMKKYG